MLENYFLKIDEVPKFEMKLNDNAIDITLKITNPNGQTKSVEVSGNPSESTKIHEYFYTDFCDKKVLVVVVRQHGTNIDTHGWDIYNVILSIKDGALVKVIDEGQYTDNATNEIHDTQTKTLTALKSGKQTDSMCNPERD